MRPDWSTIHALRMGRHLLGSADSPDAVTVADRVGGLQAQVDSTPPLSVLARNVKATPTGWSALARMWTLRGTVHLVPERDVHRYAAALGDSIAARETRLWPRQGVSADAEDELNEALLEALAGGPLDRQGLAARVGEALGDSYRVLLEHPWGIGLKPAVARGLVRLAGSGSRLRISLAPARARAKLGTVDATTAQAWLARKYLDANVAGSPATFSAWSGLGSKPARRALEAAAEDAVTIDGRQYLTTGPMDGGGVGAIALLPSFDPYTLAVADKTGFCSNDVRPRIYRTGGWVSPVIVRDGLPVGVWRITGGRTKRVEHELFTSADAATTRVLARESARIESYLSLGGSEER